MAKKHNFNSDIFAFVQWSVPQKWLPFDIGISEYTAKKVYFLKLPWGLWWSERLLGEVVVLPCWEDLVSTARQHNTTSRQLFWQTPLFLSTVSHNIKVKIPWQRLLPLSKVLNSTQFPFIKWSHIVRANWAKQLAAFIGGRRRIRKAIYRLHW